MESTQSSKSGRRVYLINPKFQLRVIAYALFLAVITILVFYISNLYFFWKITSIGTDRLHLAADHPFFGFIAEQKHFMNSIFVVTALIAFLVIAVSGLFWSHRIAGPIYRLQKHLQDIISQRTYKKLSFRKNDSFSELADSVNEALLVIREVK